MGLTNTQMILIKAIAEKRYSDIKQFAIACCEEDKTQKNAAFTKRYKNMMQNEPTFMELPYNIKNMVAMEDVSNFRTDRYYLSKREESLLCQIKKINNVSLKLMEMGIPYLNSILLTGESGTGKTTFGRYVAKQMELPFLYLKFSYLIDSLMGKTARNLSEIFDYVRRVQCILMLDEIDCISQNRNNIDSSAGAKEFSNVTITLLQELDKIQNDSIVIGATNIPDALDPAIRRRFSLFHEVLSPDEKEETELILQFLASTGMKYDVENIKAKVSDRYKANGAITQSAILNNVVAQIADALINEKEWITF